MNINIAKIWHDIEKDAGLYSVYIFINFIYLFSMSFILYFLLDRSLFIPAIFVALLLYPAYYFTPFYIKHKKKPIKDVIFLYLKRFPRIIFWSFILSVFVLFIILVNVAVFLFLTPLLIFILPLDLYLAIKLFFFNIFLSIGEGNPLKESFRAAKPFWVVLILSLFLASFRIGFLSIISAIYVILWFISASFLMIHNPIATAISYILFSASTSAAILFFYFADIFVTLAKFKYIQQIKKE